MNEMVLYIKTGCPFCRKVTDYMDENDVDIDTKNISENDECRVELENIAGKTQTPCLVVDGDPMHESDDIIQWLKNNAATSAQE